MHIISDQELLEAIEAFLEKTGMAPTRFGRETMGDGSLLTHLKAGRSPSLRNAEKIVAFMKTLEHGDNRVSASN
ncbi:MAG: hypothetical protein ACRYG4_24680 [Janthinobacterium lividum]